jgi:ferric-dicitrate binding protein FerR (iron transport regulator)
MGKNPGKATPMATTAALNAVELPKVRRRRWLLAVTLGLLMAALAATGVWFYLLPAKPVASKTLRIPEHPETVLYAHPEAKGDFQSF